MALIEVTLKLRKKTKNKAVYSAPNAPVDNVYISLETLGTPLPPEIKLTVDVVKK